VMALQQADVETASLDARLLLQHVLGITREQWMMQDGLTLSLEQDAAYQELIAKRAERCPLSQLVGEREFWGRSFRVTGDTLDPRPDSETLIEAVLTQVRDRQAAYSLLDLGTGTGCLLLTLLKELPNARGVGVDVSREALAVAQQNAKAMEIGERVTFLSSSWGENVRGRFDIVISNPPYIPTGVIPTLAPEVSRYEPMLALDGGADGLDCYRAIAQQLPQLLAENGFAALEIGIGQDRSLESIVAGQGLQVTGMKRDMAGIPRCILLQKQTK